MSHQIVVEIGAVLGARPGKYFRVAEVRALVNATHSPWHGRSYRNAEVAIALDAMRASLNSKFNRENVEIWAHVSSEI